MCNLFTSNQERRRGIQMKTHIDTTPPVVTSLGGKASPCAFQAFPPHQTWEWLGKDQEKRDPSPFAFPPHLNPGMAEQDPGIRRKGIHPHLPVPHLQTWKCLSRNKEKREPHLPFLHIQTWD